MSDVLNRLIKEHRPSWFYQMGKVGYECNWCRSVIRERGKFENPEEHNEECAFAMALQATAPASKSLSNNPGIVPTCNRHNSDR